MSSDHAEALRQQLNDWLQPILSQLDNAEEKQDWVQVERLCKQALQRDGDDWSLWKRLVQSHEQRAQIAQAETLWRHLTQRFADRPEPYLALAALQRRRGDADSARVVLEQAKRRLGDGVSLQESLAHVDDPWAVGETVPKLGPDAGAKDLARALQLVQQHLDSGRIVEAEAVLEQILQLKPLAGSLQLTLARLRYRRGDNDLLITQLEPLLQDSRASRLTEYPALSCLFARALIANMQWQRAQAILEAVGNVSSEVLFLRAQSSVGLNDDDSAFSFLKQSLQIDPSLAEAECLLAELFERRGDWESSIAALTRAAALEPTNQQVLVNLQQAREQRLWRLGENLLRQADWEAARQAYLQLLAIASGHRQALSRLDLLASLEPANLLNTENGGFLADSNTEKQLLGFERSLERLEAQLKMLGVFG